MISLDLSDFDLLCLQKLAWQAPESKIGIVNGRRIFATWYKTRWLLESRVVDLRPLITDEIALEDFEPAFAKLEAGEACKIVVYPGGRPTAPRVADAPVREPVEATSGPGRWTHR